MGSSTRCSGPVFAGFFLLFCLAPAHAVVDGEAALLFWFSEDEVNGASVDSEDVSVRADLWFNQRWGLSGAVYRTDPDTGSGIDYFNIDGKIRIVNATSNNWLALGLGYQDIDAGVVDSSGFRLTADGHLGLMSMLQGYARFAWIPDLDDLTLNLTNFSDGSATEFDIGLMLNPVPMLGIYGGWRRFDADFDGPAGTGLDITTDGPYLGIGVDF